jgi:FOG: FHA domain
MSFGKLILTGPGDSAKEFSLARASVMIGRASNNDIVLSDAVTSRNHTRVECGEEGCTVVDLGSANGTRVNGSRVDRATLAPGDVITIGKSTLRFAAEAEETDLDATRIETEGDLEVSLRETVLEVRLEDSERPSLAVLLAGRTWEVPLEGEVTIGRRPDNVVVLDSQKVSRNHACVEFREGGFFIRDLGSDNGTWIGAERVTRRRLEAGDTIRIGDARLLFKGGFGPDDLTVVEPAARGEKRARRPVVIVPGFMGSELWQGSERIWPNVKRLFTHPDHFKLREGDGVEARGIVNEVVIVPNLIKLEAYGKLVEYLEEGLGYERGKDLLEFGWDFRKDCRISARQLGAAIEAWKVPPPITIIAHSMGCVVSRYYVERLGGKSKVERLLFLGGPLEGSPRALTCVLSGPNLLPFGFLDEKLRRMVAGFPGAYQGLPTYPCGTDQYGQNVDWYEDPSWLPAEHRPYLASARDFRAEMKGPLSVPTVCVFGYGLKTVTNVNIDRGGDGVCRKIECTTESAGDTTIPESAAILPGTEFHPVRQYHGTLHADNDVKMRLKIELTRPNR